MNKLTKEEKAEVAARKRHKSINQQIRGARGVTVEVPIGTPESSEKMGLFIRASTGRSNGKEQYEIMKLKRDAVAKGYLINDSGEIIADARTDEEKEAQGDGD